MKKIFNIACAIALLLSTESCGIYSFGGVTLDERIKTVQIDYFPNNAALVEPTLSQEFTLALQDLFVSQTNLDLVNSGGDIIFEGEITGYRINPMTATSQQTAAQNRLTVSVNVRYFNKYEEENDFERTFSFFHDYDANAQLTGSVLDEAFEVVLERLTQDIFNESVAKW
jgi:hypothetical protein